MTRWPKTEADLAAAVISWLKADAWEVYQEVIGGKWDTSRADIVAVRGPVSWIIECKRSFSFDLMEQAAAWVGRANFVSVAYPHTVKDRGGKLRMRLCEVCGVGLLAVHEPMREYGGEHNSAIGFRVPWIEEIKGPMARRLKNPLAARVKEEHKSVCPAGSQHGGFWTPRRETWKALLAVVEGDQGVSLKDAVTRISAQHHYCDDKSARGAIRFDLDGGHVPGVVAVKDGRRLRLYTERYAREHRLTIHGDAGARP